MLIDLTNEFVDKMMVYPGDTMPTLRQTNFIETDHYNGFRVETGLHTGTHVDGPMHMTESKTFISEIDINNLYGSGCIIDIKGMTTVNWDEKYLPVIKGKEIVLFHTGHSKYFGAEEYNANYPVIGEDFAKKLVELGIKMIGVDSFSPDYYPFPVHSILLGSNVLIAENLTNLDKLLGVENFEVIAFPLKIKTDGAMARVAAKINI